MPESNFFIFIIFNKIEISRRHFSRKNPDFWIFVQKLGEIDLEKRKGD